MLLYDKQNISKLVLRISRDCDRHAFIPENYEEKDDVGKLKKMFTL